MPRWMFEPEHTAAEFCVRHMMVTNVRGHFKNVQGTLEFDPELPALSRVEAVIDARGLWSGEGDPMPISRVLTSWMSSAFPRSPFAGSQIRLREAGR